MNTLARRNTSLDTELDTTCIFLVPFQLNIRYLPLFVCYKTYKPSYLSNVTCTTLNVILSFQQPNLINLKWELYQASYLTHQLEMVSGCFSLLAGIINSSFFREPPGKRVEGLSSPNTSSTNQDYHQAFT